MVVQKKSSIFAGEMAKAKSEELSAKCRQIMKETEMQYAPMWDLNPLWNTLTESEKEQLAKDVELVHYAKNEIIHHDGDESEYVWMLLQGKVRIYKEGIGQRQQIIRLLWKPACWSTIPKRLILIGFLILPRETSLSEISAVVMSWM